MTEPCPTCGRRAPGNKKGKMELKRKLAKKLCTIMAWGDSEFQIQNRSLLQTQMEQLINKLQKCKE